MTIYYQCVSCAKTSEQKHCQIKTKVEENKTTIEAVEDLKTNCTDHWEMIKARVFITLFLVWVCFAIWGKYVSQNL